MNKPTLALLPRFPLPICAAAAALAAAISSATTAMAVDYPVLDSQGSTAMDESFFDRAANWTNATLQISIPPSDPEASSYDYLLQHNLRSPSTAGLHVFHSHFFRVKDTTIGESLVSGVGTNRFENDGLRFHNNGGVSVLANRHADVTYEGTVLVTSTVGSKSSFSAGDSNGNNASILRLAGTLKSDTSDRHIQCGARGLGARVVIEADATGFTGTLYPQNANGWVSFGCSVFNGTVAPWNGSAIGTELATSVQLKALTINNAGTTLIVPFSESAGRTGTITVTNSFTQSGAIFVQLRGDLPPPGKYPVLRLASGSTGNFDQSQISFGGFVTDLRASKSVSRRYASTTVAAKSEQDGSTTLCIIVPDTPTVISVR